MITIITSKPTVIYTYTYTIHHTGLLKAYSIAAVDAEILDATVDVDGCPTSVVAEAAELNR